MHYGLYYFRFAQPPEYPGHRPKRPPVRRRRRGARVAAALIALAAGGYGAAQSATQLFGS